MIPLNAYIQEKYNQILSQKISDDIEFLKDFFFTSLVNCWNTDEKNNLILYEVNSEIALSHQGIKRLIRKGFKIFSVRAIEQNIMRIIFVKRIN